MARADSDGKAQRYIEEIKGILLQRYPEAKFRIGAVPEDPGSIGIYTYSNDDNAWELVHLVSGRLTDILLEEDISIHVIPLHLEELRTRE